MWQVATVKPIGFIPLPSNRRKGLPGRRPWLRTHCQCSECERRGFDPWVGKIPGAGNGNPLQCSCLENPTDRGAWRATVHGVAKSRTRLK